MTRRDYIAIAKALRKGRPIQDTLSSPMIHDMPKWKDNQRHKLRQWEYDRMTIADVLAADNPRFDRQRFYDATEKE